MKIRVGIWVAACLVISACSGSPDGSGSAAEDEERPEDRETVFDPMVGTIDRAKGVEDLNMQRKDEMDRALEEQE